MSSSSPPPGDDPEGPVTPGAADGPVHPYEQDVFARVSPLNAEDPPKIGDFWIDGRLTAGPAGVVYTAHHDDNRPAMVVLLSEGAAADAAARDRLAGVVNQMHIDTVLARGGHGQADGRLGRRYRSDDDDPVAPDEQQPAPWAALAYDGSPAAAAEAERILDQVQIATLGPQGRPSGPDYRHYWIDRARPGLARLWPLPWPGRYDRAGWRTIVVSWLLMILLAALAVLLAILIFRNAPPQTPPPPTGGSGSPPPQSSSPQGGSPSPDSASPSPESGSPSPESGSPSPSPSGGSPSASPSESGSPSSGSASPSGTESGGGSPSPSGTESGGNNSTPGSRL